MNNYIKIMNLEKEEGLYQLSSTYYKKDNVRKFGMSQHLNGRMHNYNAGGEYYEFAYIFKKKLSRGKIYRLEQAVLKATEHFHPTDWNLDKEWRCIDREELHKITIEVLATKGYIQDQHYIIEENFQTENPYETEPVPECYSESDDEDQLDNFNARDYQVNIIQLALRVLMETFKFYLELATGAGKTFIVFNILKELKPDIIFCLSPRLKINKQNISEKYLSILGSDYQAFNLSEDKDIDKFMKKKCKKIIVGCYKSINKVYDIIINHNIIDPSIWFDESHNSVENWINKFDNKIINYLMTNNNIKYRLFTSASPDKDTVNSYENIFGKLYNPIKVKELINLKYLCPLKPMMYYHNSDDIDILKYSLDNFTELKRTWALSFHNEQINAKIMFEKHLTLFNNDETDIKPFLIISDKTKFKTIYNYDDINEFENTINSIAYVVRQCDMGYDKKEIDFVIFSDRKMSYKDIIQCIGRGLRPDKLKNDGTNKDKDCILLLPVFIDDETKNKYKKVLEVLRYLILD